MPLFYFDVHEGDKISLDDEGSELKGFDEARREAKGLLPTLASDELPDNGDKRVYMVLVRDSSGQAIYTATLTFAGLTLIR